MATARHPKATFFVQRQLFSGLTSFAELEQKIAALPDEQSRGAAFEVFAEAYLATQRKYDAAQVWPHGSVPLDILKNLGLTQQDQGVDGVMQTLLGQFNAYQIKFRTGRPALTWRELSTFIGLADSPHIHSRVLLTNCDELPAVLNDRQGFFCIRGSDLDRLEAGDFRAIEAWLADAAYIAPKKSPQPHQTEALDALLPALQTHDRVSAIMACGTGKTLVALWVAENVAQASSPAGSGGVPAARILVLLPSLALLRQTLHEWLRETHLPSLAYLCVCSDPTVKEGVDALTTQQSDLDFQVSTDAASVRSFLDAPFAGVKMIFSTYQSASVVGAVMQPGESFDFAVFDEAHKTAGREGRNFAFALNDKKLSIRKRLFLTATPRHYSPHKRDREGEAQIVFSMDNPEVYGPQAYRLTFADAARRGIICRYKVLISVITSDQVTNEILKSGEVLVDGATVRAQQVANQIALRDAIKKYGASKIFTFHKTVKSAASFVADGSQGLRAHLPEFETLHVNGKMPTSFRERIMRDFRASPQAVLSNARCLTEGVDVPAVDMVAFLSPRRSLVDIVQATGRAMRRSPGKSIGFVLVPLYLELATGETIETAVTRANFSEVWDVLQSLQEQDDVLADYISRLAVEKRDTKAFESEVAETVEFLGETVQLGLLKDSIAARVFEELFTPWDIHFGELVRFKNKHGHCRVSAKRRTALGYWVTAQRTNFAKGLLSSDRINKLEALGFEWDLHASNWQRHYADLRAFINEHGHCRVPQNSTANIGLSMWIQSQRQQYASGQLHPERVAALESLGFKWKTGRSAAYEKVAGNLHELNWQRHYAVLQAFIKEHGHCHPPKNSTANIELSQWTQTQRRQYASGKLSAERVAALEALGPEWRTDEKWRADQITANQKIWEQHLADLAIFKSKHGHCRVSHRDNERLGAWVSQQRMLFKIGKLSSDRIASLEALGFEWHIQKVPVVKKHPFNQEWLNHFVELENFKAQYGHCRISHDHPAHRKLGWWIYCQRNLYAKGKLSPEKVAALEALGFEWLATESENRPKKVLAVQKQS